MKQLINETFIKVIGYIYQNVDNPSLNLEDIATESGISTSSLKRLFKKYMDQSPGFFIRRLRMELAFQSIKSKNVSILETALSSGFEDHSAFSRQFKKTFGYSPAKGRLKLNILNELESISLEEPDIVDLHAFEIQCITEKGIYFECAPRAWTVLSQKLNSLELTDDFPGLFIGIGHDNPHEDSVLDTEVRFSAGISLSDRKLGIETIIIAAGSYARFRYVGKLWNIGLAYHYIYGKWKEQAPFKVNKELPAFMAFDKLPHGTCEEKIVIHVPIID